jgi:hypothetical protein
MLPLYTPFFIVVVVIFGKDEYDAALLFLFTHASNIVPSIDRVFCIYPALPICTTPVSCAHPKNCMICESSDFSLGKLDRLVEIAA